MITKTRPISIRIAISSSTLDEIKSKTEKLFTKTKKVIYRGKRIKTVSEVRPVENISKNLLSLSPVEKRVLPSHKLQDHAYEY